MPHQPGTPDPRPGPGDDPPPADAQPAIPPAGEARIPQETPALLGGGGVRRSPSLLDLARMSRGPGLSRGREEVYRHIARLTELQAGQEFLLVPSGRGEGARFLVELTDSAASGVDPDAQLVETAVETARAAGLASRLHYDQGSLADLPYKDDVFDLAIGEVGMAASADAARAIEELVRVTKPLGSVVVIQPVWNQKVEPRRQEVLSRRLGLRPHLLQQWKQMLRAAGVVELHVEDLSEAAGSRGGALPATGLVEFLSVGDGMVSQVWQAWLRWRWQGVSAVFSRDAELRRLVTRERLLGLALIKGRKWVDGADNPS